MQDSDRNSVRYMVTEDDVAAGSELWRQSMVKGRVIFGLIAVVSVSITVIVSNATHAPLWQIVAFSVVFSTLWMLGNQRFCRVMSRRKSIRLFHQAPSSMRKEASFHWDAKEVSFTLENAYQKLPWHELRSWSEDDTVLVLLREGPLFYALPKRAFSSASLDEIRSCLAAAGVKPAARTRLL